MESAFGLPEVSVVTLMVACGSVVVLGLVSISLAPKRLAMNLLIWSIANLLFACIVYQTLEMPVAAVLWLAGAAISQTIPLVTCVTVDREEERQRRVREGKRSGLRGQFEPQVVADLNAWHARGEDQRVAVSHAHHRTKLEAAVARPFYGRGQ